MKNFDNYSELLEDIYDLFRKAFSNLNACGEEKKQKILSQVKRDIMPKLLRTVFARKKAEEIECLVVARFAVFELPLESELSADTIKKIHALAYVGKESPGVYKLKQNCIRLKKFLFFRKKAPALAPAGLITATAMSDLVSWYNAERSSDLLYRTSLLILRFILIHPFMDGNGRTARLLFLYCLAKKGAPYLSSIAPYLCLEYYMCARHQTKLAEAVAGIGGFNYEQNYAADPYIRLLLTCLQECISDFNDYIEAASTDLDGRT